MRAICIFHYHLRPSGVRSVLERTLPMLLKEILQTDRVVFLTGEAPDAEWAAKMQGQMAPRKVNFEVVPELSYLGEIGSPPTGFHRNLQETLGRLFLRHRPKLVWAHNLSVGRNPLAAKALNAACKSHGSLLFCHHHDWWPEVRWERFAEMQRWGVETEEDVAEFTCPEGPHVRHAVVHPRDAAAVGAHVGLRCMWMPNLGPQQNFTPTAEEMEHGRLVLASYQPYWLMPTRLLGRKNPLEALFLAKLLGAKHFAVLGTASSPREQVYLTLLEKAAEALEIRLTVDLAGKTNLSPNVLLALSEGCLQTSLLEGWGLPGAEAAMLKKPFILRQLPGLDATSTPYTYQELLLPEPPTEREIERREQAAQRARSFLPAWWKDIFANAHHEEFTPWFSHLSPCGQLDYLRASMADAHQSVLDANPWIQDWRNKLKEPDPEPTPQRNDNPMDEQEIWLGRFQQLMEAHAPKGNSEHILSDVFARSLAAAKAWPWLVNTEAIAKELAEGG